ncbi:MAG TPA: response regulator, partial [Candidatus Polarisedimenticolaceae bacterium]|nr:response regulator [Candidatus Polarisedimenticolaceae bacterium]
GRRAAATHARLAGLPVLVVDDNATNRRILEQMLGQWGLRPTAVAGGDAALELVGAAPSPRFALALVDANMPRMDGFALCERMRELPGAAGTVLVMLTSAGRPGELQRSREIGVTAYLTKPVKQSDLFDTVVTVLGQGPQRVEAAPAAAAVDARAPRPLHLLLAEDNPINQRVAATVLEKRGHAVVIVASGRQALEAAAAEPFDLILMDVQMPEMDGLEATAAIRRGEAETGRRVPIVAMTAHAQPDDRERCLAAGMDGYLAKPIHARELLETVERLAAPPLRDGFDERAALTRVLGDRELLRETMTLFLRDAPAMLARVREAVDKRRPDELRAAAHALKGSVLTFGSGVAAAAALRLEVLGREARLDGAAESFAELERGVAALDRRLREFLKRRDT